MPPANPPGTPEAELRGKVVYIEDAPMYFELIKALLARHRAVEILHASTGQEGVELVRSERPDFVLLDMHLPDMSGLDVVRMLSEDIANRRLHVTILTGDELSIDIIKAMSLGAFEYLIKPVSPQALERSLRRALAP
jgi:DNA-binding response OmpR family regulator